MTSSKQAIPEPSLKDWLLSFIGLRMRLKITGDSMLPALKAGDLVLANKTAYKKTLPKVNDVVVAFHPLKKNLIIIKRVASVSSRGSVFLQSDNPLGSDSRQFGEVPVSTLIAKVIAYSPK